MPHTLVWLLLCVGLAACGRTQIDPVPDSPTPQMRLAGSWRVVSDDVFHAPSPIRYLQLPEAEGAEGGLAEVFASDDFGVLGCTQFSYAQLSPGAVAVSFPLAFDSGESAEGSVVLLLEQEPDRVTFRDEHGNELVLERIEEIPASARCATRTFVERAQTTVQMSFRSGLVFDGTTFWAGSDSIGGALSVDVDTGAVGAQQIPLSNDGAWIHAVESPGLFWGFCGCGDNRRVASVDSQFGFVDQIDTAADLDEHIFVDAIAKSGTTLFLAGRTATGGKLLRVNADAEPDVLLESLELDRGFKSGMMIRDGELWIITSSLNQVLVRFDLATGQPLETVALPTDSATRFHGLATDGDTVFTLKTNFDDDTTRIVEITDL